MKKLIIILTLLSFNIIARERLVIFTGYGQNSIAYDDDTTDTLTTKYSFGTELSADIGESFELGLGLESINLDKIGDISLSASNKMYPFYIRLQGKALEGEVFSPYVFATYGYLYTDIYYSNGLTNITVDEGTYKSIGIGFKLQNSLKIEAYNATYINTFNYQTGLVKTKKEATTTVTAIRIAYIFQ